MFRWLFKRKRKKPEWTINLHPGAQTGVETAAAWTTYAGTKVLVRTGEYFEMHPERIGQPSSFDEECFARDALAEFWATYPDDLVITDDYLHSLVRIRNEGFIREYVWHFLREDTWTEPEGIDLESFHEWMAENGLASHKPVTYAFVEPAIA
ncbi:MAG: hypothetical protein AB7S75_06665 [Desulfococcaceae bacterium]